jgi:hypothetical protein
VNEWQPIETAPRDGTFYLAVSAKTGYYATLNEPPGCARGQWYWIRGRWVGESDEYKPTHWMPLPSPPPSTPKQEEGE